MKQILAGVKILDFTQFKTGPMGTQILGDLGADIIKVERAEIGDYERKFAVFGEATAKGAGSFFLAMNRNKKSLALDLKAPESKEIIYRLVKDADVVSQNFRPGIMEKLGFGYED
jgi:crotonobetainyl-CoA:carnitine CoA-transferase CaiB-like acyl-CoA transferase